MGAPQRQPAAASDTRRQARDHLLLNFTDMGEYADAGSKIIVRGEGCDVIDDGGRRFIDGISPAELVRHINQAQTEAEEDPG